MHNPDEIKRRTFLAQCGLGLGSIALANLEGASALAAPDAPKAKRVIYLHMAGSPPQQDLFDYKPKLNALHGKKCPKEFIEGKRLAFIKGHPDILGAPHPFKPMGGNGLMVSKLMPHFEEIIDEVTIVRSMHTDQFNHAPAQLLLHTGSMQFGGASLGAWVSYALGSANENLPSYVVMVSGSKDPSAGKALWGSSYLPSQHQATRLRGKGDPILYLNNPKGMSQADRRRTLDAIGDLNRREAEASGDREILARIEQYELAYRMQASVPSALNLKKESKETLERYGAKPGADSFANNCLMARRLVEEGVRFVQLFDWGWDLHGTAKHDDLMTQFPKKCQQTDRPIAALVTDLKERGMLDDTLVIWGGEFGRTAMMEARNGSKFLGRDHHPDCFTMWMAGGGMKKGYVHGETDELGYTITKDPVSIRDLQHTILHLLGQDGRRLTFPFMGLNQRLIGPAGEGMVQYSLLA